MNTLEIGKKIKSARDLKSITLDEIASRVGVAKSTIQRYETGKIEKPKLPVIESIANALEVNPAWLIGKSEAMEPIKEKLPKILDYYNSLNDLGKHEATKRVEELTYIEKYTKSEPEHLMADAAHADEKIKNPTSEMLQEEEKIMDDDNF